MNTQNDTETEINLTSEDEHMIDYGVDDGFLEHCGIDDVTNDSYLADVVPDPMGEGTWMM